MIVKLPGTKSTPSLVLAQVADETSENDTLFVITVKDDGEVWIRTTDYEGRDLHVAAAHLMHYSIRHVDGTRID